MRRFALLSAPVLAAAVLALPTAGAGATGTDCPPVLNGDGTVTFRYCQTATSVSVVGEWADPIGTSTAAMTQNPVSGVWSAAVALRNHLYSYTYTVNGTAGKVDPSNPPWDDEGIQSQFFIPGSNSPATPTENYGWLSPNNAVPHGTLHKHFLSTPNSTGPFANGNHPLAVYTPPGYETSTRSYPTIYLSHGAGGNDVDWSTQGYAGYIEDNLIAAGQAEPAVLVMTNFYNTSGGADGYRQDLVNAYIPFVESNYRVYTERWSRIFAGLSMGGQYGQNIIINSSDKFGYFGIWSPAPPPAADSPTVAELQAAGPQGLLGAHLGSGITDLFAAEGIVATEDANMTAAGIPHRVHYTPTDVSPQPPAADFARLTNHTWDVWREELRDALQNTFFKVKSATTTTVTSDYVQPNVGQQVTFTAHVAAANTKIGNPDVGTVDFKYNGVVHSTPVTAGGTATFTTTLDPAVVPRISARFVPAPGTPFLTSSSAGDTGSCPWMDVTKTPAQRASELLAAMTIDNKIALVHGGGSGGGVGNVAGNAALCIPAIALNDGPEGVGNGKTGVTALPAPIGMAASFNRTLVREAGAVNGIEHWGKGSNVWLGPGQNIGRVPLNGRNFEYFSEDPLLAGEMSVAEVRGAQEDNPTAPVVATAKHYALNNQETGRSSYSMDADARTAHEIYLPSFEAAVEKGHVGAVMCAYNRIEGIYACQQSTYQNAYLKGEFGFDGWIMSDWGATHSTAGSAAAGLDMEMPGSTYFGATLKTAVQGGTVPAARLDDMVYRILYTMFRIGLFDYPPPAAQTTVSTPEHVATARTVSEEGSVLLKNTGILPLTGTGQRIALIGQPANSSPGGNANSVCTGGGSAAVNCAGLVTPNTAITARGGTNGDTVTWVPGTVIADAVAAAAASDLAIVFAYYTESEGSDRSSLSLDGNGDTLIQDVATANPNTIVVLNTGGPVLMPWLASVKSVIEAWYPGQEDGNAIAALLFGDVNPSGKLPETFPKAATDLPTAGHTERYPGVTGNPDGFTHATYSEGLQVGYRWYDAQGIEPLFCFGHGLSYTTFSYSGLTVTPGAGNTASVSFTVENTGNRAGAEVPQVYVGFPAAAGEPPKQLKGFEKVFLGPGESQQVTIPLNARAFSYWSASAGWTVAGGTYRVSVGSSSCDTRLQGDLSMSPTAVKLRSFTARRTAGSVVLRWRTGTENGLIGFNVYRGTSRLTKVPVAARNETAGSAYRYVDRRPKTPARYRLQAIRLDGSRTWLGSASAP